MGWLPTCISAPAKVLAATGLGIGSLQCRAKWMKVAREIPIVATRQVGLYVCFWPVRATIRQLLRIVRVDHDGAL